MTIILAYLKHRKAHLVLFLLLPILAIGQDSFPDDTNDLAPPVPINNYLLLGIFVAIYIAFRFFKRHNTTITKNYNN